MSMARHLDQGRRARMWSDDSDPFNTTKCGYLGFRRATMLDNYLLRDADVGKRRLPYIDCVPKDFSYGNATNKDSYGVVDAYRGWPDLINHFPINGQKLSNSFVAINKGALHRGAVKNDENRDYQLTHGYDTCLHHQCTKRLERPPKFLRDPALMVHGKPLLTNDSQSKMFQTLAFQWQTDWIKSTMPHSQEKAMSKIYNKKCFKDIYETRTTQLRMKMKDTGVPQPPWKMPKFERKAQARLSSFRSRQALESAMKENEFEKAGRMGIMGQGIPRVGHGWEKDIACRRDR